MSTKNREFKLKNIREQQDVIEALLQDLAGEQVPREAVNDIRLALVEGINNAFIHGAKCIEGDVSVSWHLNNRSIRIEIADKGTGFEYCPEKFSDRKEDNLLCEGGMGVFLIQQVMDEIFYNEKGNVLCGLKTW